MNRDSEQSPKRTISPDNSPLTRRRFLRDTAGVAAGVSLGLWSARSLAGGDRNSEHGEKDKGKLPKPEKSGIEHIVVVTMENRSFDHFLGWLPEANGRQAGLSYKDKTGMAYSTHPLAPDFQGCGHPDPDHSYQGARVEYDNGACDGWLRAGANDIFSIGYYQQADLPFLGQAAQTWTTCDNYFAAILAGTYPNRIYHHAAQTDRLDNSLLPVSTLPTIWDRLAERNVSRKYYFSDFPFLALWGLKYLNISRPVGEFYLDCAAGNLPQVSYVEPRFLLEEQGLSADDHPHSDIRNGEAFLNKVYSAITSSPAWANTVMVINFDEWGGFFDHVAPTKAPIPAADAALGSDGLRGFRVPSIIISPWSPRGTVAHGLYDHTSVLKMIEWRWNLRPLTVRDVSANNLAEVLNFKSTNLTVPQFAVPQGPFGVACPVVGVAAVDEFPVSYATSLGFPIP